jgi:hypothetical protein
MLTAAQVDEIEAAAKRLRMVDGYGIDWGTLLRDRDTDPQMIADVVLIVRAYLELQEKPNADSSSAVDP